MSKNTVQHDKRRDQHGARLAREDQEHAVGDDASNELMDPLHSQRKLEQKKARSEDKKELKQIKKQLAALTSVQPNHTVQLSRQLETLTGLESRVTILGYLQRGGTPSAADRLLATRLGTACADLIHQGTFGVMVAARGEAAVPVPLEQVAGNKKLVPVDHPWIVSARNVGTSFGA